MYRARIHSISEKNDIKVSILSSAQVPDDQLWGATFNNGLQPCVRPTAKYKGKST